MAGNNVIDELQIKVRSDTNLAVANLDRLQTVLRRTAKSIGTAKAAIDSLNKADMTFKRLGNINASGLANAVTQLERLSKIDFENLKGKTFEFKFMMSGADEVVRKKQAVQKALESVDTKGLSKKFSDSLALSKADAKKVETVFQQALTDVANGGSASKAFANWYDELGKSGASVFKDTWVGSIDQIKKEYDTLVAYLKNAKIKPPNGSLSKKNMEDYGLTSIDRSRYFSKNGQSTTSFWDDMMNPSNGMNNLLQGLEDITNEEDQIIALFERMKWARDMLAGGKTIKVSDLDAKNQAGFWEDALRGVSEQSRNVEASFAKSFDEEMTRSSDKIPLNVDIDSERIRQQIKNAIDSASKETYSFPVKINLDGVDIKQQFSNIVQGIDASSLGNIASGLEKAYASINGMGSVDMKSSGINSFVNSVRKLTEADMSKFNAEPLNQVVDVVRQLGDTKGIEAGIINLVSAFARLANAGDKTQAVATALPTLGRNLRNVANALSETAQLSSETQTFISSIGQLANTGNKANNAAVGLTALGKALKELLADLSNAPQASENVVRLTEALGQLASSGGKAGTAAKSVSKSIETMGGEKAVTAQSRLSALLTVWRGICNVFEKGASTVVRGAQRIFNNLKKIGSLSGSLQGTTQSIKSMIGAMIGFRGITGLAEMLKETIELGGDLTEIDHIVESVFGNMSGYVDTWAKSAITQFGIAEEQAKRYAGTLSSMFQASQIGYMDAGKMSLDLVSLAGDLSAFYNIDTETAYEKIRSGMAGMVRPLRKQHCAYVQKCA